MKLNQKLTFWSLKKIISKFVNLKSCSIMNRQTQKFEKFVISILIESSKFWANVVRHADSAYKFFFVCTLSLSLSSSTPFSTVYNNVQFHINLIFPSILGVFVISLVISTAVYRYTRQSCNPNYIKDFVTKRTSISYVLADVYLATIRTATWR